MSEQRSFIGRCSCVLFLIAIMATGCSSGPSKSTIRTEIETLLRNQPNTLQMCYVSSSIKVNLTKLKRGTAQKSNGRQYFPVKFHAKAEEDYNGSESKEIW